MAGFVKNRKSFDIFGAHILLLYRYDTYLCFGNKRMDIFPKILYVLIVWGIYGLI